MMKELCSYNNNEVKSVPLSSVTRSINTGLNPRNNFTLNETGADLYYLTVKEITSDRIIISKNTDKITWNAWNIIQKRSNVEKGDVLFSGIGTIGKVVYVEEENKNWNCSESLFIIKPIKELIDGKYLAYILTSNDIVNQYEANAGGSIMKGVRKATLQSIILPLPSINVQRQIVSQLDTFTTLISQLERELELRQKQYEHYREELLNFEGDEEVEWKTLGDICSIVRGASPRPIQKYLTSDENGVNWIKIGDVESDDKYVVRTKERITKEGAKKSRYLQKGSFILSNSMSFGRPYILQIEGCIHDGWIALNNFENGISENYLYEIIKSKSIQAFWANKANKGGAMSNLNSDIVKSTLIAVPPKYRQQQIVSQLDTFEQLISALKREIALRRKQYEYYREKLLTFD